MHRRAMLLGTSALAISPLAIQATAELQFRCPVRSVRLLRATRSASSRSRLSTTARVRQTIRKRSSASTKSPKMSLAAAEANFLPKDKLLNGFTPVLVNSGKELVLFDSGNGVKGQPATGHLAERMKAAGVDPEQIDVVVITHCHPDHIGGLMSEGTPLAPKARYVIGEAEYQFWSSPDRAVGPTANAAKVVQSNVVPLKDKMTFVKNDGEEVVAGIRAVEAFGDTPGHRAWHLESGGKRIRSAAISATIMCCLCLSQMACQSDADKEQAVATRLKLLDMLNAERIPFTSYHMPFPAVGFVEKGSDGGYRFVPRGISSCCRVSREKIARRP